MKNKDVDFIISYVKSKEKLMFYWHPTKEQSRRKDRGWVHLSDLRKILKEYNNDPTKEVTRIKNAMLNKDTICLYCGKAIKNPNGTSKNFCNEICYNKCSKNKEKK